MEYNEFVHMIMAEIRNEFPDYEICEERIQKLQDQSYNGLAVRKRGDRLGITLNLDRYYKQLKSGRSVEGMISEMIEVINGDTFPIRHLDLDTVKSYSLLKEKLIMQMVPVEGNKEMLSRIPHKLMEDIAIVYRIMLYQDENVESSILLTNDNLKGIDITEKQLEKDALDNCKRNHPLTIRAMSSVIHGNMEDRDIWIVSNESGRYGASVICYPNALETIAERIGSSFYLVPSSIHEFLVLPESIEVKASEIDKMITEVNKVLLSKEDSLTNHCYHYDEETGMFERGAEYEERKKKETPVEKEITLLLIEPGKTPIVIRMENELHNLQSAVGGFIEVVYPFENDRVCIICNEEGKVKNMDPNRAIYDNHGNIIDIVAGPFLLAGIKEDNIISLTNEQIMKYKTKYSSPEFFIKEGEQGTVSYVKELDKKYI